MYIISLNSLSINIKITQEHPYIKEKFKLYAKLKYTYNKL